MYDKICRYPQKLSNIGRQAASACQFGKVVEAACGATGIVVAGKVF